MNLRYSPILTVVLAVAITVKRAFFLEMAEAGGSRCQPVQPLAYTLSIRREHRPEDGSISHFHCEASIQIKVSQSTDSLVLHTHSNLAFLPSNVVVLAANKTHVAAVANMKADTSSSLQVVNNVTLNTRLQEGESYLLNVSYNVHLNREPYGLHNTHQPAENGSAPLIMTVLSPSFARRLVPCFGDPPCPATFQLTLETKDDETAVSSTDVLRTEPCQSERSADIPGCELHTFERTPVMSPSQLGFVVSQFGRQVSAAGSRYLAVYVARRRLLDKLRRHGTMCVALKLYAAYTNLSGVEPGWNIKLVAVRGLPYDSVEALGLVLLRESALIFTDESPSAAESALRWVLSAANSFGRLWFRHVISNAHAQATPWYQEGLTRFLQYHLASQVTGEMLYRDLLYSRSVMPAMFVESLQTSHPLKLQTASDSHASIQLQDAVTSGKGKYSLSNITLTKTNNSSVDFKRVVLKSFIGGPSV